MPRALGLVPITTPAYSPESHGFAEAFAHTFTRDYARITELRDATRCSPSSGAECRARLGACRRNALDRAMRRVQLQGGARRPHARRTLCTLSVRPRAPTPQMGPYHRSRTHAPFCPAKWGANRATGPGRREWPNGRVTSSEPTVATSE